MSKFSSLSRSKGSPSPSSRSRSGESTVRSGGKVFISVAVAFSLVLAGALFFVVSKMSDTVTYYVLNQDVAARSQVTGDMLTPVTTSRGGEPRNALNPAHLEGEEVYARYALSAGDLLTPSNVGLHSPIQFGVPEDFVVASFTAPADRAVAGKIRRGDYIDIIAVGDVEDSSSAQYVLRNVLVLDATADLAVDTTAEVSAEDGATRAGIPTLYTVALPEHHAVRLALVQDQPLLVVLTPIDYDGAEESNFVNWLDVFGPEATVENSGLGTDNTFSGRVETEEEGSAEAEKDSEPAEGEGSTGESGEVADEGGDTPTSSEGEDGDEPVSDEGTE